jgi:hypothetical protein
MEKEFVNADDVILIEALLDVMVYTFAEDASMK